MPITKIKYATNSGLDLDAIWDVAKAAGHDNKSEGFVIVKFNDYVEKGRQLKATRVATNNEAENLRGDLRRGQGLARDGHHDFAEVRGMIQVSVA